MYLFADTTYHDFIMVIFDKDFQVVDKILIKNTKHKVEQISQKWQELANKHHLKLTDIKGLYTSNGPGFFTGVRTSLMFFQTWSLLENIPLYVTSSFNFFKDPKTLIDARGGLAYEQKEGQINLVKVPENYSFKEYDYPYLINDFVNKINLFIKQGNVIKVKHLYIKKPNIGTPKWKL